MKFYNKNILSYIFITSSVLVALLSALSTQKPTDLGFWVRVEPSNILILVAAVLGMIGFLCIHRTVQAPRAVYFSHPYVVWPFLIFAFSAVLLPAHSYVGRFISGPPQTGEGPLWYLTLSILIAGGFWLKDNAARTHTTLKIFALILIPVLAVINQGFQREWWSATVLYFQDFLAYLSLYGFFILINLPLFGARVRWGLAVAMMGGVFWFSENMAFQVFGTAIVVGYALISRFGFYQRHWKAGYGIAALLLPFVLLGLIELWDVLPVFERVPSLGARAYVFDAAWRTLQDDPSVFLTGKGWGIYGDLHAMNMPLQEVDLAGAGYSMTWDGAWRHYFHSHHYLIEALVNMGLGGMILSFLWLWSIPFSAREDRRHQAILFALLSVVLASFWFAYAFFLPFMALALADLADRKKQWRLSLPDHILRLALAGLAILVSVAAWMNYDSSRAATRYVPPHVENGICPDTLPDHGRGGMYLAPMSRQFVAFVSTLVNDPEFDRASFDPEMMRRIRSYMCLYAQHKADNNASPQLLLAELIIQSDLAFDIGPKIGMEQVEDLLLTWEQNVRTFVALAPRRMDQAAPYIMWRLARGEEQQANALVTWLEPYNPGHPVILWFKGLRQLSDPATAADGLRNMRRALELNLERILPVDPEIRKKLGVDAAP